MEHILVAIRDDLAVRFYTPVVVENEDVAKRYFEDTRKHNEAVAAHPGDYSLWKLGKIDMKEGQIEGLKCPELLERGQNGGSIKNITLQN